MALRKNLEVLTALDSAKMQWYHFTTIVIAGMGFFTDAYDLFCISIVSKLLGRLCYHKPATYNPSTKTLWLPRWLSTSNYNYMTSIPIQFVCLVGLTTLLWSDIMAIDNAKPGHQFLAEKEAELDRLMILTTSNFSAVEANSRGYDATHETTFETEMSGLSPCFLFYEDLKMTLRYFEWIHTFHCFYGDSIKPQDVKSQIYYEDLQNQFLRGNVTRMIIQFDDELADYVQSGSILDSCIDIFGLTRGPCQGESRIPRQECMDSFRDKPESWMSRPEVMRYHGSDRGPKNHPPHPNRTAVLSRALATAKIIAVVLFFAVIDLPLTFSHLAAPPSSHGSTSSAYDGMASSIKSTHKSGKLRIFTAHTGSYAYSFGLKDEVIRDEVFCDKVIRDEAVDADETMPWYEQQILQNKQSEGEMSDATPPKDNLMNTLAPLFRTQIKNALEPVLGPVTIALQNLGEEERKQRQKLIALEEKKLALKREKVQCLKRRRACRFQPILRAPSAKSSAKSSRLTRRQGLHL